MRLLRAGARDRIPPVLSARMAEVLVFYLNQRSYIYSKSSVSLAPKVGP